MKTRHVTNDALKLYEPSLRSILRLFIFPLALLIGGCGTTIFTSYTGKMNPMLSDVSSRKKIDLSNCLRVECQGNDKILYNMERGRIAQVLDNVDSSMRDFECAMDAIKVNDEKATVSASQIGGQVAGVLVNENAIPYEGEGYERVMLHHFQAMNYLRKKDLEGAGVEVRRANLEQQESLKRHESEIEKAQKQAEEKKIDSGVIYTTEQRFAQMDEVAGKVKNSFQNAYTFYVSGVIYELLGQPNDAYIDYKRAIEIFPGNKYLQKDVIRLAHYLEMEQDLADLKARFNAENPELYRTTNDAGEIIVFYEDDFVQQKQDVKFPIPLGGNLVVIAFPMYRGGWTDPDPLTLTKEGEILGFTEPIAYIDALAVKALKEKIPGLVIRQVLRATAKAITAKEAEKRMGGWGKLGANIWNLLSENADVRSWISLPQNAQIFRTSLPPGMHRVGFLRNGIEVGSPLNIEVSPGDVTILHVIRAGSSFYAENMVFARKGNGLQVTEPSVDQSSVATTPSSSEPHTATQSLTMQ